MPMERVVVSNVVQTTQRGSGIVCEYTVPTTDANKRFYLYTIILGIEPEYLADSVEYLGEIWVRINDRDYKSLGLRNFQGLQVGGFQNVIVIPIPEGLTFVPGESIKILFESVTYTPVRWKGALIGEYGIRTTSEPPSQEPQQTFEVHEFVPSEMFPDIASLMYEIRSYTANRLLVQYSKNSGGSAFGIVNLDDFSVNIFEPPAAPCSGYIVSDTNGQDWLVQSYHLWDPNINEYRYIVEVYSIPDFQLRASMTETGLVWHRACLGSFNDMLIFWVYYAPNQYEVLITDFDLNQISSQIINIPNTVIPTFTISNDILVIIGSGFKAYSLPDLELLYEIEDDTVAYSGYTFVGNYLLFNVLSQSTMMPSIHIYSLPDFQLVNTIQLDKPYVSLMYCNNKIVTFEYDLSTLRVRPTVFSYPDFQLLGTTSTSYNDPLFLYIMNSITNYIGLFDLSDTGIPITFTLLRPL